MQNDLEAEVAELRTRVESLDRSASSVRGDEWWRGLKDEKLRSVRYIKATRAFDAVFSGGQSYRLPRTALTVSGTVASVHLSGFGYSVKVKFTNGRSTEFPSDLVLFECEPGYRAWIERDFPPNKPINYGRRIRSLREEQGKTAVDVAAAAKMPKQNYWRIESGKHVPQLGTCMRIAKALNVPVWRLIARDGAR